MLPSKIQQHQLALEKKAQELGMTYLALYGSHARGEATADSDLDLLADFDPTKKLSLIDLVSIQRELSALLDENVDLVTKKGLDKYIKPYIQDDLKIIYAKKS